MSFRPKWNDYWVQPEHTCYNFPFLPRNRVSGYFPFLKKGHLQEHWHLSSYSGFDLLHQSKEVDHSTLAYRRDRKPLASKQTVIWMTVALWMETFPKHSRVWLQKQPEQKINGTILVLHSQLTESFIWVIFRKWGDEKTIVESEPLGGGRLWITQPTLFCCTHWVTTQS